MKISRRTFLKVGGVATAGAAIYSLGLGDVSAWDGESNRTCYAQEITTICPYCSVGCGVIGHVRNGKVVNVEGDPDHPINEGALCSKGSAMLNMAATFREKSLTRANPNRLTQVLYRAPRSRQWEVKTWDWALEQIAKRIKATRDKTFTEKNSQGVTVNRTPAIAWLGSAMVHNEENYLFHKFARSLGLVNIDHCARL